MHKPTTSLAFSFIFIAFVLSLTLSTGSFSQAQTCTTDTNCQIFEKCLDGTCVLRTADYAIALNSSSWTINQPTTLILILKNLGPDPATAFAGVSFPTGFSVPSAHTLCSIDNISVDCSVPMLNPGESITFSIEAIPTQSGQFSISAFVSPNAFDPNSANNSATSTVDVGGGANQQPVLNEIPSINMNEGADEFVVISASDPDGDALSFNASSLPFANLVTTTATTATWRLTPGSFDEGIYTWTITVTDGLLSDSQEVSVTVNNVPPQLSLTKDDGGVTAEPGDNLTYTIVVTNTGVVTATDTIITDTVPDNTTFDADANTVIWNCPDGAGPGTECGYTIGDLPSGSTAQVTFVVNVNATLPPGVTKITNTVEAKADGAETTANAVTSINIESPFLSLTIPQVQGAGHISPYVGQQVAITGTVTLVATDGFWMEDPFGDDNPYTSDGIFVLTDALTRTLNIGDNVRVTGLVHEFRHSGPNSSNLTITEIFSASATLNSTGNPLRAPVVIGAGGRVPPKQVINTNDGTTTVEDPTALYLPGVDGVDFWESLEGMQVQVYSYTVVGPTSADGTIWGVGDGGVNAGPFTERDGLYITPDDFNPERIQFGYDLFPGGAPNLDNRSAISGTLAMVDYDFRNYLLQVIDQTEPVTDTVVLAETTDLTPSDDQITIATFNVNDLNGASPTEKFDGSAKEIVNNLGSPDSILLQGVGDDNGADDGGIVSAEQTLTLLQSTIKANGGPDYNLYSINPLNGQNSGTPGDNPRTAFFINTDRFEVTERPGGDAVTPVTVDCTTDGPVLNPNPGLIDPTNLVWEKTSKPLALEGTFVGERFYLFNVDLVSPVADDPLFGRWQPPIRYSELQRLAQAQVIRGFVDDILACNPNANVIIAGGVYDPFSSIVGTALAAPHFASAVDLLVKEKLYNQIKDGNSQLTDNIFFPKAYLPIIIKSGASLQALTEATPSIQAEVDIVHVNAEFAQDKRVSDRDPIVARFTIGEEPETRIVPVARDSFLRQESKDTNEGANPRLVVRKHARAVVAFDLSAVTSPPTTATLELTVVKSQNWGDEAGAVNVHRLWQSFAEGNGFVLGQTQENADRGNGPGTTHHCATDAEISNNNPDCAAHWQGGELGAAENSTDSALHTNDLTPGDTVRWDVTADVLQALAEGANEVRWLLQKQGEENDGEVIYYSKEGDANFGPRLILE